MDLHVCARGQRPEACVWTMMSSRISGVSTRVFRDGAEAIVSYLC
jgi:hypothetical protein